MNRKIKAAATELIKVVLAGTLMQKRFAVKFMGMKVPFQIKDAVNRYYYYGSGLPAGNELFLFL